MSKKLLIIDDSLVSRRNLAKQLRHEYDVVDAPGAQAALEMIPTESPDVILCDLLMPGMDGFEFLESAKDFGIPVIVLSADIQSTSKERALGLGARCLINKPAQPETLLSALNEATG